MIRTRVANEARVGSVGLRLMNGTKPVRLNYMCNNVVMGQMETSCFEDKRLLIRRWEVVGLLATPVSWHPTLALIYMRLTCFPLRAVACARNLFRMYPE